MQDNASLNNPPDWTTFVFNNTSSSVSNPQNITWTSTATSIWCQIAINANCVVQLLTDVPLPINGNAPEQIYGSLICGTHVLNAQNNVFILNPGASIYTANTAGLDATISSSNSIVFDPGASYIYNGSAAQVTGASLPATFGMGGSVAVNNAAGVTLSQYTSFGNGSTVRLINGSFNNSTNLELTGGSYIARDHGTFAAIPTFSGPVNVGYFDLGNNAAAITTGVELPTGSTNLNDLFIKKNVSNGVITLPAGVNPVVNGSLTIEAGTLNTSANNNNIFLAGNWTNNSGLTALNTGTGTLTLGGTGVQNIGGTFGTTFYAINLNNSAGAVLGNNEAINGLLTLTNGTITLGANNLTLNQSASAIAGSLSSSNMIIATGAGQLRKRFAANGSYTFPVGDNAANYTPIALNVTGTSYLGAYVGITVTAAKQPNNANVNDYLNRYWSVFTSGITGRSYSVTSATYVPGDVSGTESSIAAGMYVGALPWAKFAAVNTSAHTLSTSAATSINAFVTGITAAGPTVSVTAGSAYCGAATDTLTATSYTGDPSLTFSWAPSTGLSAATGTSVIATPTVSTTYTLTVTDGNGLKATATTTVSINFTPAAYSMTGGGTFCAGGTGFHIGLSGSQTGVNYQLYLNGSPSGAPLAGTGSGLDWGFKTAPGIYTAIGTAATGTCTTSMTGAVTLTANPRPNAYTVTGTGSYCSGGTGLHVGLAASDVGINYQLYRGTALVGTALAGTGSALDFGLQIPAGTYTVLATNPATGCTNTMTGSAIITINPLPNAYTITGGGSYCSGGTGLHIGLAGSATGISYQMYRSGVAAGSPLAGTGSPLDFGLQTLAGTYTVIATNTTTGCVNNMTGTPSITVLALPTTFTVTGGGSSCAGGVPFHIYLSGSVLNVTYYIYKNGVSIGSKAGTGAALDFGTNAALGTYTITGTSSLTGCSIAMTGSAVIDLYPTIPQFTVSGGGSSCPGGLFDITQDGSTVGVNYQLYRNGNIVSSVPAIPGTGAALDFGFQSSAGTYTVVATRVIGGCTRTMLGNAIIVSLPLPGPFSVNGGGIYCTGGAGVHVGLAGSAVGVNYQLFYYPAGGGGATPVGSLMPGTGSALDFGAFTGGGVYRAVGTFAASTCSAPMADSATITVVAAPSAYVVSGTGTFCTGGTGLHVYLSNSAPTAGNVTYYLLRNGVSIGSLPGVNAPLTFPYQTTPGTYTVLALSTLTGCTSNMTGSAVISSVAPPVAGTISGPATVANGGVITLTDPVAGGVWSASNSRVTISPVGVVTGVSAGAVTISYTVTNGVCNVSALYYITETGAAPPPVVNASVGTSSLCVGANAYYTNTVAGGTWSSGDINVATIDPVTGLLSAVAAGVTPVIYTVTDGAGTASTVLPVTVQSAPDAVVVSAVPTAPVADGQTITFSASVSNGAQPDQYQWLVNGTAVIGATQPVFTAATLHNNDEVACQVTGACGQTISNKVRVTTSSNQVKPVQLTGAAITLVPNPNKGVFALKGNLVQTAQSLSDEEVAIEITDVLGKQIFSKKVTAPNGLLDETISLGSNIANGSYILSLSTASAHQIFHLVIEQ
jgi:hypothetical protein